MPKIFLADDEDNLVQQAREELFFIYQVLRPSDQSKGVIEEYVPTYDFCLVDLTQAMEIEYWHSLDIQSEDAVVLDIDFHDYKDPKTQQKVGLVYNGENVLHFLEEKKQQGFLSYLERVLVATSNVRIVDPRTSDLSFIRGFDVYGLAKGRDAEGRIINYGKSIVQFLNEMYEDLGQQRVKALNYGLKNR